jgi:hypothetical protein
MFKKVLNCDSTYFTLIHSFYYLDYKFTNSVTIYLSRSDSPCFAGLIPVLYFLELPITYSGHLYEKLSHYRPGQGSSKLRLPEFPISTKRWQGCQPHTLPPWGPEDIPGTHFWVDPRPIVRPEGLMQWKNPMTPMGIEPTTPRLGAHSLNRLHRTC